MKTTDEFLIQNKEKIKEITSFLEEHEKWKKKNGIGVRPKINYIRYEIEERKFSGNILIGISLNENEKEKRNSVLSTFLPKIENDSIIDEFYIMFQSRIR